MHYLAVGIGGIIGSLLRYFVGFYAIGLLNSSFPLGTLFANIIGSYFLGLLTGLGVRRKILPSFLHVSIGTGLIGSFTTFSTFSTEMIQLLQMKYFYEAFTYIVISAIGGLCIAALGYRQGAGDKWKDGFNR